MSDDKAEELKKNILSPSQWIRILYMAFYAIACWVLTIVLTVIIIAQILISLITGEDNENLRKVGKKVSDYFHEMLDYLVYATHEKPWPFSEEDDDFSDDPDEGPGDDPRTPAPDAPAAREAAPVSATPADTRSAPEAQSSEDDEFADISFTSITEESISAEPDDDGAHEDDERKDQP